MERIEQLCTLLDQERECILQYEAETMAVAANAMEEIEEHMQKRTQLQTRLDWLIQGVERICGDDEEGKRLLEVVRNQCIRGTLPPGLLPLFDRGMAIRAAVLRIREIEPQAVERMSQERDQLLEKIKSVNQGNSAAASRYYRSTLPKGAEGQGITYKKV